MSLGKSQFYIRILYPYHFDIFAFRASAFSINTDAVVSNLVVSDFQMHIVSVGYLFIKEL